MSRSRVFDPASAVAAKCTAATSIKIEADEGRTDNWLSAKKAKPHASLVPVQIAMSAGGFKVVSGGSLAATFEGEFSMSRGPYASKGRCATRGDKGLPVLALFGLGVRVLRCPLVRLSRPAPEMPESLSLTLTGRCDLGIPKIRAPVSSKAFLTMMHGKG
jgi:hypothetical protein